MHRRRRQVNPFGDTAQAGNQLAHLEPHKQSTVTWFCTLAVLDLNGSRVALHIRNGPDDLVPAKVAGSDLQDNIFEIGAP